MNDLENMNKKAEMSKELATHYSPFQPLNKFNLEELKEQPTMKKKSAKDKVLDVNYAMKIEDTVKIKKLEE